MAIGIRAVGSYVPDRIITNQDIEAWTDREAAHVERRTGIQERRYAEPGVPTSALAEEAVRNLLFRYPDAEFGLGGIIVATSTPDQPQPPTAAVLQGLMRARGVPAWDLNAVCAGSLFAMVTGAAYADAVEAPVLVVGADKYSGIMDRQDWTTVSLFGDGAGAVVLGQVPDGYGLLGHELVTDAEDERGRLVQVQGGGTAYPLTPGRLHVGADRFTMYGPEVRRWVLEVLPPLIGRVLADAGKELGDVDRYVFHQANPRMLGELADLLGIERSRVPLTAPKWGNSGAASMLVTLADSVHREPPARGDLVLFAAVGGGMGAGAALVRWWE